MYQHFYKFEYGGYAFFAGAFKPELAFRCTQVAVLYDQDTGTLLKHGIPPNTLHTRLRRGWTVERTLTFRIGRKS